MRATASVNWPVVNAMGDHRQRRRLAARQQQPEQTDRADREGRGHQRPRRHAQTHDMLTGSTPDGRRSVADGDSTAATGPKKRRRLGLGRPPRPHRPARRRRLALWNACTPRAAAARTRSRRPAATACSTASRRAGAARRLRPRWGATVDVDEPPARRIDHTSSAPAPVAAGGGGSSETMHPARVRAFARVVALADDLVEVGQRGAGQRASSSVGLATISTSQARPSVCWLVEIQLEGLPLSERSSACDGIRCWA